MRLTPADIPGAYLIDMDPIRDHRGYFARAYCRRELAAVGIEADIVQCSVSHNERRATLRGIHFQKAPHAESKIIRCTRGAVYDVIVDLRPESPAFRRWLSFELSADNGRSLFIPPGLAHGFQTLSDNTEVFYMMTEFHNLEAVGGVRWNDPAFGIAWPIGDPILSERDANFPDFPR